MRLFLARIIVLPALLLSAPVMALDAALSVALMRYDSRERDDDGASLNRESGWLPVLSGHLSVPLSGRWSIRFDADVASGSVNYDGQTQLGLPFRSHTDIDMFRARAAVSYCTRQCEQQFYGGVGGYLRQRDIQGRGGVSSLSEGYRWAELQVGLAHGLQRQSPERWRLHTELFYLTDATLKVDLRFANYGQPVIALPDSYGYRLALAFQPASMAFAVSLGYEHLRIDRSATVVVASPAGALAISEPASEANHWRLAVTLPL